jgi:hypothetical protein
VGYAWDEALAPPLLTTHAVLSCNRPCASDRLSRQPTLARRFAQSSCANKVAVCADRRHPLYKSMIKYGTLGVREQLTYVQGIPNCRWRRFRYGAKSAQRDGRTHFPCTNVLMLNPRVGLTERTSSLLSLLMMVVFPALSSPLQGTAQSKTHVIKVNRKSRCRRYQ